jgi:hypothetical protein
MTGNAGTADRAIHTGRKLDEKPNRGGAFVLLIVLLAALSYAAFQVVSDLQAAGEPLALGCSPSSAWRCSSPLASSS